ncbi:proline--tRNA ligase [Xiamenia xianingshaonis]|uniref:Proline--tRNA ligase n=1 Tax=Xiamenia xianingshaonis TaxID=2682776 RepID=A0A9E6MQN9_9ACTN|nr:proline--tRNA ligase [Xiamenia xianingshaonis]NGM16887.1 proline--tRNA ligase [Eggerthellaceae bacterium zg-893]NHM14219.1 proline--tRNA ligase [Xiamenia xianingshaonis]NHM15700.1 proline--tRNA ligase [Xiamenia xianingshaonis]QTU84169.1 proline--tRNA ligase [Xiamenia xianingshaonis]
MSTDILRMSELYAPTLKETPTDAEIASHQLLLRAGFIRKTASGIYTFLPLGYKVIKKIENIVREEMDAIGSQEILMPVLQPAELWHESGRWNDYGPELMRLCDRHDHDVCLGPTHEELIVALVRNELRSYKQLPLTLYQIQVKFRDEIRPRFGLLRSREFIMKDAYSYHTSQESLQQTYDDMMEAYGRICDRTGLDYRPVQADGGQIGGSVTCEFMALADAGEAELVYCSCGYAANTEAGECIAFPTVYDVPAMEKIATPGVHTIAELAEFLGIPETSTVKALSGKNDEGKLVVLFVPGDHEVNELKAARVAGGFSLLTDEDMEAYGLHKGSMGPVGLPEGAYVIADRSLQAVPKWVVGANEDGFHLVGAQPGVDFTVDEWADLSTVKPGDSCPECGLPLESARGIEVSQVFQLGDKYSRAMNATYMAEDGSEQPYIMGCYGVGISRTMAAIVEQHNDEHGISWPASVAPAHVCIVPLTVGDEDVQPVAEKLARDLAELGVEVVIDDRKERPGVKFADADLIGWPIQVVVGKRGLAEGNVEVKRRSTGERRDVSLTTLEEMVSFSKRNGADIPKVIASLRGMVEG